jgi:hypothetical protein
MIQQQSTTTDGTYAQRVEHKYWLPAAELDQTISALQSFIPLYRYARSGTASVRTVCLDSADMRCYQNYLDGLSVRWKIRIRQYGEAGRFGEACWVEIKMKNKGIGSKRRFCCSLSDLPALLEGVDISTSVVEANGPDAFLVYGRIAELIKSLRLRPKVRIDYERFSFQHSPQAPVRITLDRDLRFQSANRQQHGSMNGLVLELKYNGLPPDWFKDLYDHISLNRAHRFSKYARAIDALNGNSNSGALA